jgi:hypothetical protein
MEIRFISSLTAQDEEQFAPAVLQALSSFLDQLPIAYTMRIETMGGRVFQHTHAAQATHGEGQNRLGTVSSGHAEGAFAKL